MKLNLEIKVCAIALALVVSSTLFMSVSQRAERFRTALQDNADQTAKLQNRLERLEDASSKTITRLSLLEGAATSLEATTERSRSDISSVSREIGKLIEQSQLLSPADGGHRRLEVREFIIRSQIRQAPSPIVIIGDSITEAALLPESICGHRIVNAGIGGLAAANYAELVSGLFDGVHVHLMVVAIGINDAQKLAGGGFETSYNLLLQTIEPKADRIILAGITDINQGALAEYFDAQRSNVINSTIEQIAKKRSLPFINLRRQKQSADATIDGIHLSASGYSAWLNSITSAIQLNCPFADSAAIVEPPKPHRR